MGVSNYVERMSVKRDVVGTIAFIDDDLNVFTCRNNKRDVDVKKNKDDRVRYHTDPEKRKKQNAEYRARNPEKVKEWQNKNNEKNKDKIREWQITNKEKCARYTKKYHEKKRAEMTQEQKKQIYQQTRQRMIEKHGLQGWRDICNERAKKVREKKRDKNSKS
jgi:hypothetical protein